MHVEKGTLLQKYAYQENIIKKRISLAFGDEEQRISQTDYRHTCKFITKVP